MDVSGSTGRFFPPRDEREVLEFVIDDFPFPIALTYARLQQEMDRQEPVATAWQLRDAFEVLIKFCASLAVADVFATQNGGDLAGELAGTLLTPQGLSLGHWHNLLDTALAPLKPFARDGKLHMSGRVLPDLFDVFYVQKGKMPRSAVSRSIAGGSDGFVAWRNRVFGHGVFQQDRQWYATETLCMLEPLHRFYEALRPVLAEWRLVCLEADGGEISMQGAEDLPLISRHEHEPFGDPVSMVLVPRSAKSGLHLPLSPLLSVQVCRLCKQPATFFFDRLKNKKRTILLEYARGHHHDLDGWADVARVAQLVPPAFEWVRGSYDSMEITAGDSIVFRDFEQEYQRPDYLLQSIWQFVDEETNGYIQLVGPAGTGKTYLVRGLSDDAVTHDAVVLPYHIRPGALTDAMTFLNELHLIVSERLTARTPAPQLLVSSADDLRKQFVSYLRELITANGLASLVIAIDALDELTDPAPGSVAITDLLPDPEDLPDGCYVLLTSREMLRPRIRQGLERVATEVPITTIRLDPSAPDNQALVQGYLAKNLPERFQTPEHIAMVLERSGGIFLYAYHLAHALGSGVFTDTQALPEAEEFYPAYLASIRNRVGESIFDEAYLQPLIFLSVAQQPVTLEQLVRWGVPAGRLAMALFDLRDFLRVQRVPGWHDSLAASTDQRYELAHEAFARFVRSDPVLNVKWRRAHEVIANNALTRFSGRWNEADPYDDSDLYALSFTLAHAGEAGLDATVYALLGNRQYADACWSAAYTAGQAGRSVISLRLYDRVIDVYRNLVTGLGRADLVNDLASALMNRGNTLQGLGRLAEAVAAYDEAIGIRRALVAGGRAEVANDLASALMNRGNVLQGLGRLAEAMTAYDEVIEIRRALVAGGRAELANDLAMALMNRGVALKGLGRLAEAVAAYDEAIGIRRALVAGGRAEVANDLAGALMNRGNALQGLGRLAEAVAAYDEAIEIRRALVAGGRAELANDLAMALMNRGVALKGLGRLAEAVAAYDEAIGIRRALVADGREELAPDLAMTLRNKAVALEARGDINTALECYDDAGGYLESGIAAGMANLLPGVLRTIRLRMMLFLELQRWGEAAADVRRAFDHAHQELASPAPSARVLNELHQMLGRLGALEPANREAVLGQLGAWESRVLGMMEEGRDNDPE